MFGKMQKTDATIKKVELKKRTTADDGSVSVATRIHLEINVEDDDAFGLKYIGEAVKALAKSGREKSEDDEGANSMAIVVKRQFLPSDLTFYFDGQEHAVLYGATIANRPKINVVEGELAVHMKLDVTMGLEALSRLAEMVGMDEDVQVLIMPLQKALPFAKSEAA